jgi:hypothetical protein
MYVYTFFCIVFTLIPPFPVTSSLLLVSTLPPGQDLFSPALLFSDFSEEKREKIKRKT